MTINHVNRPQRRQTTMPQPDLQADEFDVAPEAARVIFRDGAPVSPSPERSVVRWAIRMHLLHPVSGQPVDDGHYLQKYQARRYECIEQALLSREMDRL